eukprot:CAMPEP_0119542588 /NCGR_PEP_ID=MMETSP1344-20130328/53666_1 /TAXON_ID=236787 /ORGANISM="Florenciella parvula, Strain CCMP2471" /LENGTH=68 /DNA_ID=CAMNT_0007586827 /DNA_START=157 /DNA_END=363 /DNA_ORIENTATION=-
MHETSRTTLLLLLLLLLIVTTAHAKRLHDVILEHNAELDERRAEARDEDVELIKPPREQQKVKSAQYD